MKYTILEIVRALNTIKGNYKHPMYAIDESIADISFDNEDTTSVFNTEEYNRIVYSFIEVAKKFEDTEFGRLDAFKTFHKCFIEDCKVTWKIKKLGKTCITIKFNTETSHLHKKYGTAIAIDVQWMEGRQPETCMLLMVPTTCRLDDAVLKHVPHIFRANDGEIFVLRDDMMTLAHSIRLMYSIDSLQNGVDFNELVKVLPNTALMAIDTSRRIAAPIISFHFYGMLISEPTFTLRMYSPPAIYQPNVINEEREQMYMMIDWASNYIKDYKLL